MHMLNGLALAGSLAIAVAAFPAMAQQDHDHGPSDMMGQGGMMGQSGGSAGGMMGQSGGMMGNMRGMMGDKGGMMGGCSMMGGGMMGRGMHGMMMSSVPMMEGRLAYMKADLGITDAQASAWEAYAAAVRAQQTAMQSMHDDMMKTMGSGSALDRMDMRIKAMESMVESLKTLKPATTALYAVLSDAQKEKANQLLGGACGMM
jgi:hypothetical protein